MLQQLINSPNIALFFLIGVGGGFLLHLVDYFLFLYYGDPNLPVVNYGQQLFKNKKFFQLVGYALSRRKLMTSLLSRSLLFLGVLIPLSFFVITSTTSFFGKGLILGIMLHVVWDLVRTRTNLSQFHQSFLWQIKRQFTQQEVTIVVGVYTVIFVMLCLLFLV